MEEQPKSVIVVGGGYIGVELAGIFNALGSKTSLAVREQSALRTFDSVYLFIFIFSFIIKLILPW